MPDGRFRLIKVGSLSDPSAAQLHLDPLTDRQFDDYNYELLLKVRWPLTVALSVTRTCWVGQSKTWLGVKFLLGELSLQVSKTCQPGAKQNLWFTSDRAVCQRADWQSGAGKVSLPCNCFGAASCKQPSIRGLHRPPQFKNSYSNQWWNFASFRPVGILRCCWRLELLSAADANETKDYEMEDWSSLQVLRWLPSDLSSQCFWTLVPKTPLASNSLLIVMS